MPVTDVSQDLDNCTLTMTAEFAAPVERVWSVYANRSSLEKVWGPPGTPRRSSNTNSSPVACRTTS